MADDVKVLVVDDNRVILRILKDGLEKEGFRVETASSGVEALEKVLEERPSVILLDIVMPGVTGYEVCRVLRNDPSTLSIPIIMVTGSVPDTVRREGYEAGANDIWAKPVNVKQIGESIRSYLEAGVEYQPITESREIEILRENIALLARELRSPVTSTRNVAEMLSEATKIEAKQVAEVLQQQVDNLMSIVHRLERLSG